MFFVVASYLKLFVFISNIISPSCIEIQKMSPLDKSSICSGKFQCLVCGKILSSKQRLKMHTQGHTGVRELYKCNHCGREFTWKDSLRKHIKFEHSFSWIMNSFFVENFTNVMTVAVNLLEKIAWEIIKNLRTHFHELWINFLFYVFLSSCLIMYKKYIQNIFSSIQYWFMNFNFFFNVLT